MLLHSLFITNSCTQLKHFHNFHLKLYTLIMFVMRTKSNLKNPTCFDRFADHHQGSYPVPCTIITCQFSCFFAFLLCGGMFSAIYNIHIIVFYSFWNVVIWDIDYYTRGYMAYLYVCACAVLVGVVSGCVLIQTPHQQALRKHTHIENRPPHNYNAKKQEKLTSSNCTRHGNQPLMMVGEPIETCRVF